MRRIERGRLVKFPVKSFERASDAIKYAESTRPDARKVAGTGQVVVKSPGGINTVSDLYAYCKAHTWKRLSPVRIDNKESRWTNHIEPYWGPWPLSTVRHRHAQEWITEKEEALVDGKGLSQLGECRTDLIGYFRTAIKNEFYEWANPFEDLDFTAPLPRKHVTIESQQFADVLYALGLLVSKGLVLQWVADVFTLSLLTGMREGESMALRGHCINLERKAVLVNRSWSRKARNVDESGVPYGEVVTPALSFLKERDQFDSGDHWKAIPDPLLPLMTRLKDAAGNGLVFCTADGKLKEPTRFYEAFDTLRNRLDEVAKGEKTRWSLRNEVIEELRDAGVKLPDIWEAIVFRDTRNSFASYAAEVKIPEAIRMALMGHKGETVIMIKYTDLTTKGFLSAQEALSGGWTPRVPLT